MPESFTTADVTRNLKISVRVVQRWLADPYFRQNQIAVKFGSQWRWDKHKLSAWLIAVFKFAPTYGEVAENPGDGDVEEKFGWGVARQKLGMPLNYSVRLGHKIGD